MCFCDRIMVEKGSRDDGLECYKHISVHISLSSPFSCAAKLLWEFNWSMGFNDGEV